jgi:hypothetical protein
MTAARMDGVTPIPEALWRTCQAAVTRQMSAHFGYRPEPLKGSRSSIADST